MFGDRKCLLYIDVKLDKVDNERMKEIFLQVFGTYRCSAFAKEIFYRLDSRPYLYCYMDDSGVVYGYSSSVPIEKKYQDIRVIPLSTLLNTKINLGGL